MQSVHSFSFLVVSVRHQQLRQNIHHNVQPQDASESPRAGTIECLFPPELRAEFHHPTQAARSREEARGHSASVHVLN